MLQAGGLAQQGGEHARGGGGGGASTHLGGASWPPFAAAPDPRDYQAAQNAAQLQHSVMMLTQLVQVLLVALQSSLAAAPAPARAPQKRAGGAAQAPPVPLFPDPGQLQPLLALMGGAPMGGPPLGGPLPFPAGLGAAPDFLGGGQAEARGATNGRWGGMQLWRTTRDILAQAGPQGMSIRQITQQLQQSYSPGEQVNVGSLRNTLCQRKDTFRRLGAGIWTLVDLPGGGNDDDNAGAAAPGRRRGRRRAGAGSGRRSGRGGGSDEEDDDGNGEEEDEGWGPVDDEDGAAAAAVPQGLDGPSAAAGRRRRAAAAQSGGRSKRQRLVLSDVDEDEGEDEPQRNGDGGEAAEPAAEEAAGDELPLEPRQGAL